MIDNTVGEVRVIEGSREGQVPAGWTVIGIDRQSIFGNPFVGFGAQSPGELRAAFLEHLGVQRRRDTDMWRAIVDLARRVEAGECIALRSWCEPEAWHGEVLAETIRELVAAGVPEPADPA